MARKRKAKRRAGSKENRYGQRIFGDVLAVASTLAESRRHMAAERLNELASATRTLTDSVEDLPYLREYTDAAAERIDELADYVDRTDFPDMLEDAATFAKRQPMATLALGVAAGLVTTQLMRGWQTSRRRNGGDSEPNRNTRKRGGRR
jgi:hypothetical protein